jgi:hypothetical protein
MKKALLKMSKLGFLCRISAEQRIENTKGVPPMRIGVVEPLRLVTF